MLKLVTSHEPIFRVASKTESMGHISVPPLCIVISSLPTIHRARMNILEPLAKLTRVQGEHSRTNMQHFLLVMGVFFHFFFHSGFLNWKKLKIWPICGVVLLYD